MYTAKHIQFSEKHAEALPAYYRLQQTIMDKLVNGEWQAGKQLPSERQFAQTTGFSVGTVRKALENMVHQGYLVRIQGKGTYVTKSIIDKNAVKYYRLRRNLSEQDVSLSVELLSMEEVPRQAEMDRRFAVPEDIPFVQRRAGRRTLSCRLEYFLHPPSLWGAFEEGHEWRVRRFLPLSFD